MLNDRAVYNERNEDQRIKSELNYDMLTFNFKKSHRWFDIFYHSASGIGNPYKEVISAIKMKHNGFFIQPEYSSTHRQRMIYFDSDTNKYEIKNITKYSNEGYFYGYSGQKISFKIKKTLKFSDAKKEYNLNGLGLNTGPSGIQNESKLKLNFDKFSIWRTSYLKKDTSDVPILWEDSKIGNLTALDDTLYSNRIGITTGSHQFSIGDGKWSGKLWVSQLVALPFISVWPILSGSKYYLDTRANIKFDIFSYDYKMIKDNSEFEFSLNKMSFRGKWSGEQWAIIFPFITVLRDQMDVQVNKLDIIESRIKLTKKISNEIWFEIWSNIFVPYNIETDDVTDTDPKPSEKLNYKVSGGLQYGLSLKYNIFK